MNAVLNLLNLFLGPLTLVLRLSIRRLVLLLILVIVVSIALRYLAERLASTPPRAAPRLTPHREVESRETTQRRPERRRRSQAAERPTSRGVIQVAPEDEEVPARPRQRRAPGTQVPWTTRQVVISLVVVAVIFGAAIAAILGLVEFVDIEGWGEHVVLLVAAIFLQGSMLLTVWFFAVRPRGGRWALLGFRRVKPISTTIIVVFGVAIAQSAVVGYTLLVQQLEIDFLIPSDLPREWANDPVSFAIIAISAVIVAPLVEEIFFRGFMYQALRRTIAILPAALLTSLVFGIAHIDPAIIIPIAVVGMILLGIYRWTGNLWSSIITHAGYNAVAVAALAIQTWGA